MESLRNRYFGLRHGQSTANVAHLILSHPLEGIKEDFTLTVNGENQVTESIRKAEAKGWLNGGIIIYSSLFSRARRSAEIAREILRASEPIHFDNRLRERWFGELERADSANYQKAWEFDALNPLHEAFGMESAQSVKDRGVSLLSQLENQYNKEIILLVSHGDVLQILQTFFIGKSAKDHRQVAHLELGEIRELILVPASLTIRKKP